MFFVNFGAVGLGLIQARSCQIGDSRSVGLASAVWWHTALLSVYLPGRQNTVHLQNLLAVFYFIYFFYLLFPQ